MREDDTVEAHDPHAANMTRSAGDELMKMTKFYMYLHTVYI